MELAQPLRIRRNTFSIVTDYTFARSASHKTRRRFKSSIYLLADHAFGFAPGAVATPHQFHHPQRYNAVCLGNIIKEVNIRAPLRRGLSRWVSPAGKPGRS